LTAVLPLRVLATLSVQVPEPFFTSTSPVAGGPRVIGALTKPLPAPSIFKEVAPPEIAAFTLLCATSLLVGLYPRILLDAIEPAVKTFLAGGVQ